MAAPGDAIDSEAMARAMAAAEAGLAAGDLPVGAALVIGGNVVDVARNTIGSSRNLVAHAEMTLLLRHGDKIIAGLGKDPRGTALFTTLEPCLMCLSAAAHSRISRIVYACRDPVAGAAGHGPPLPWYRSSWPKLEHHGGREIESAKLLLRYIRDRAGWDDMRRALEDIAG